MIILYNSGNIPYFCNILPAAVTWILQLQKKPRA